MGFLCSAYGVKGRVGSLVVKDLSCGSFDSATCNFINDVTLAMNWHGSLFVQTFVKETPDKVVLKMQYPAVNEGYECVLEVIFTKR